MKNRYKGLLLVIAIGFINACLCEKKSQKLTPTEVVSLYLETVINITQESEKEDLLRLTTGELKAALKNSDDATFRATYLKKKLEILAFGITTKKRVTDDLVRISFYIKYKDLQKNKDHKRDDVNVIAENEVELQREYGEWLISTIFPGDLSLEFLKGIDIAVRRKR